MCYYRILSGVVMNHFTPFLGLWAWEDDKELKRCIDVYFFNSNWTSQDGKKMFSMEAEFVESNKEGTFVNIQEITIVNENRLKHVLQGYHFEHDKEEWVPFRVETFLNKLPETSK